MKGRTSTHIDLQKPAGSHRKCPFPRAHTSQTLSSVVVSDCFASKVLEAASNQILKEWHMSSQQWKRNVNVIITRMLHGGIRETWNFVAIKRMHKQWIPGSLSSPLISLGTRLTECQGFLVGYARWTSHGNQSKQLAETFDLRLHGHTHNAVSKACTYVV